jgi:hypothetical protein
VEEQNGAISMENRMSIPQKVKISKCPWLRPIILATQETDIRRIEVKDSPGK